MDFIFKDPYIIIRTYYLIVGTYGTKMIMNEKNSKKNSVRLAKFYWTAFCYVDENSRDSYSWVYMQKNDKKSCHSSEKNFMSVKDFTTKYYKVLVELNEFGLCYLVSNLKTFGIDESKSSNFPQSYYWNSWEMKKN